MAVRTGEVIFKCHPYAHVLYEPEKKAICNFCFKSSNKLITCSKCQVLKYCDSKCQDSDWTLHCIECQCLQNVAPDRVSDMTRLLIRLITRKKIGDDLKMFEENEIFRRPFIKLMSHYEEILEDGIFYNRKEILKCAENVFELPPHETILEIYGKVLTNSFVIPDEQWVNTGIGIYLSTSILNHSCAPNAIVAFDGIEQKVYALSDIPQVQPDMIFISYIDIMFPSWQRKDRLMDRYYFNCRCSLCEESASFTDQLMTGVQCPASNCIGFTGLNRNEDRSYKVVPCSHCGQNEFSPDYEEKVVDIWNHGYQYFDKLQILEKNKDFKTVLCFSEKILDEFDESLMSESHLWYIRVREFAISACTELGLWGKAAEYGEKVWKHKMKCISNPGYTIGSLLVELGKFYLNDHNISEARRVFHQAEVMVIPSHGLNNGTYKEIQELFDQCDEIENLIKILNAGDLNNNNTNQSKHIFHYLRHRIWKVFPRKFRQQVPSLFLRSHKRKVPS